MRSVLSVIVLCTLSFSALAAGRVVVPQLPPSPYDDTEKSTNAVMCDVSLTDNRFSISNQDDKASSDPLLEIAAYEKASELNLPGDWNGGCYGKGAAGTRYYRSGLSMQEVVSRMLMNGVRGSDDCPRDITNGDVRGVYYTRDADMRRVWSKGDVNVAFPWSNRNPTHK